MSTWKHSVPPRPANFCRECGQDFASLEAFDRHFTGDWNKKWPQNLDGARCRDPEELRDLGLELDARGRWHDPKKAAHVRQAFQKAA